MIRGHTITSLVCSRPRYTLAVNLIDNDSSILIRCASGESVAVAACIDRFGPLVWSLARRLMVNPQEAEDAVQDVFIEIWKNAARFDPTIASARAFVAMIARRRIIDRGRVEQRRIRGVVALDALYHEDIPRAIRDSSSTAGTIDDDAAHISLAVEQLNTDQQTVIRMAIGQGWSHQEIAERTGVPLGTVKSNLRRGLARLRDMLFPTLGGNGPATPQSTQGAIT